MAKYELIHFEIEGKAIPVKRFYERRKNVRVSVGKDSVLLRIPSSMSDSQKHKYHIWAKDWLIKQLKEKSGSLTHLIPLQYFTGSRIKCMDEEYILEIEEKVKSSSSGTVSNKTIRLSLDSSLYGNQKSDAIKALISRVLAKKYKPLILKRLELINKHYFGHEVKALRLKYNRSNWGSCSNSGNINLSTRLLMTPEWVRDYVIVHELAHMNEMNHSKNYWKIVEKVYPEYQKAEKWLKAYGSKCDFIPI